MTDHHPQPAGPAPTPPQQRYLRQLAMQRGISFVPPRTCFEASRLIDQLRRRRPDAAAAVAQLQDQLDELVAIVDALADRLDARQRHP